MCASVGAIEKMRTTITAPFEFYCQLRLAEGAFPSEFAIHTGNTSTHLESVLLLHLLSDCPVNFFH
jgi:hypothetical protein